MQQGKHSHIIDLKCYNILDEGHMVFNTTAQKSVWNMYKQGVKTGKSIEKEVDLAETTDRYDLELRFRPKHR